MSAKTFFIKNTKTICSCNKKIIKIELELAETFYHTSFEAEEDFFSAESVYANLNAETIFCDFSNNELVITINFKFGEKALSYKKILKLIKHDKTQKDNWKNIETILLRSEFKSDIFHKKSLRDNSYQPPATKLFFDLSKEEALKNCHSFRATIIAKITLGGVGRYEYIMLKFGTLDNYHSVPLISSTETRATFWLPYSDQLWVENCNNTCGLQIYIFIDAVKF